MRSLLALVHVVLLTPGCFEAFGDPCDERNLCEQGLVCISGLCTIPQPVNPIESIPLHEEIEIEGLEAPVEIILDEWQTPHIFAESVVDGWAGAGFIMARHRLAQLELSRRTARGQLAAVAESSVENAVARDAMVRLLGLEQLAETSWEATPSDGPDGLALIGFSKGVTAYIERVQTDEETVADPARRLIDRSSPIWTPTDSLAISWLELLRQTWSADRELELHLLLERGEREFRSDSSSYDLQARQGFSEDVLRLEPAVETPLLPVPHSESTSFPTYLDRLSIDVPRYTEGWLKTLKLVRDLSGGESDDTAWVASGLMSQSGGGLLAAALREPPVAPPLHYALHLTVEDGDKSVDVAGVCRVGSPAFLVGFNRNIAWAKMPSRADLTDLYFEEVGDIGGEFAVLFNDEIIMTEPEDIEVETESGSWSFETAVVPHHGPFVPLLEDGELTSGLDSIIGLTVRWIGQEPMRPLSAQHAIMRSRRVEEAVSAIEELTTPDAHWLFTDRHGGAASLSSRSLPRRPEGCLPSTLLRLHRCAPFAVLPGTGEAEWGVWDASFGAHVVARDRADQDYFVVAGADQTGTTSDNNPFDDLQPYSGWLYEPGYRTSRLVDLLETWGPRRRMTLDDAEGTLVDTTNEGLTELISALDFAVSRAMNERDQSGTHSDLMRLVNQLGERLDTLELATEHLMDWDLSFPIGGGGEDGRNGMAAAIAGAWLPRCYEAVLGDELDLLDVDLPEDIAIRALVRLVSGIDSPVTLDIGLGHSSLFDDLDTQSRYESRDATLIASFDDAIEWLEDQQGPEMEDWSWEDLNRVVLEGMPLTRGGWGEIDGDGDGLSIPNGPWTPSGGGLSSGGDVAGARLVVEMAPSGPTGRVVLAGSQDGDPESADYGGEIELWRHGQTRPLAFDIEVVVEHATHRIRLHPSH